MANKIGAKNPMIKHGYQYGNRQLVGPVDVGASEVFSNQGGHFVWFDTSRRIEVAGSGNNPDSGAFIFGWAECGAFTASSTEGGSNLMVDVSFSSVYCIPADAAVLATMRGKKCDLVTTSNIQYADVGEANEGYLIIVDVDITNQLVYVHMNPVTVYITAIA
jgi:hypothetical protein